MIAFRLRQRRRQAGNSVGQGQHQPPRIGAEDAAPIDHFVDRAFQDDDFRRRERFFKRPQQAAEAARRAADMVGQNKPQGAFGGDRGSGFRPA
jgi:hypothetical protein